MPDDAAKGAAIVGVMFVLAVTQGVWLVAVPCGLVLTLTVLALL